MSVWSKDEFIVFYEGTKYTITKLDIDLSEQEEKPEGTIIMSHKIEGFEVPLYMIQNFEELSFSFATKVIEDNDYSGLFVNVQDDDLWEKVCDLVVSLNDN